LPGTGVGTLSPYVLPPSRTVPGRGWFAYFRIYGAEAPAFDGSWKPGDFEEVK
jgi:hypothetical protein